MKVTHILWLTITTLALFSCGSSEAEEQISYQPKKQIESNDTQDQIICNPDSVERKLHLYWDLILEEEESFLFAELSKDEPNLELLSKEVQRYSDDLCYFIANSQSAEDRASVRFVDILLLSYLDQLQMPEIEKTKLFWALCKPNLLWHVDSNAVGGKFLSYELLNLDSLFFSVVIDLRSDSGYMFFTTNDDDFLVNPRLRFFDKNSEVTASVKPQKIVYDSLVGSTAIFSVETLLPYFLNPQNMYFVLTYMHKDADKAYGVDIVEYSVPMLDYGGFPRELFEKF